MTSFKDLLSKSDLAKIKEYGKPTAPAPKSNKALCSKYLTQAQTDEALFKTAMLGVKPLSTQTTVATKPTKSKTNTAFRRANAQGSEPSEAHVLSDMQALLNPVAGEAFLSYKVATLQKSVFEQLKQGKLRWYDAVDLHGASIDEARLAVSSLINSAHDNGESVVKIVHGKGEDAVIKTCINGWLRQLPSVMAFVSAPAKDGGTGAVLVLLKKRKL